jgi:hypothetical protein
MTAIEDAYRRFSRVRFPLPTEEQLSDLERRIGIVFPDDYRRFLLEFNGGYFHDPTIAPVGEVCPQAFLAFLSGIGASHDESELGRSFDLSLFDDNDPPKIVPIGGTPIDGLIILDTAPGEGRGEIYYKQPFGDFYFLADNIEEFFGLLREQTVE